MVNLLLQVRTGTCGVVSLVKRVVSVTIWVVSVTTPVFGPGFTQPSPARPKFGLSLSWAWPPSLGLWARILSEAQPDPKRAHGVQLDVLNCAAKLGGR